MNWFAVILVVLFSIFIFIEVRGLIKDIRERKAKKVIKHEDIEKDEFEDKTCEEEL